MSTRLALRIQQRFEKLAPSERKLAALMLERQDDLLTYSATELAGFAGVSKATAARLFRSLGYQDFNEVRLQAREERNRTQPFERRTAAVGEVVAGARSIGAHLQNEIGHLTRTFETLRSDALAQAAEILAAAPRVWILGIGLEEGLARHFRLLLARVRPDVHLLGSQPGAWSEDLGMTGAGDALLMICTQPRSRLLRPILDYAGTTRMQIIGVTDVASSRWAHRLCRVTLACQDGGLSWTVLVSMLHLLAVATASRVGAAARQRTELMAEIHEELEDEE